jgi:hypothetical protein
VRDINFVLIWKDIFPDERDQNIVLNVQLIYKS